LSARRDDCRPPGDPSRRLGYGELDARFAQLRDAPTDVGRLLLIVRRLPDGVRDTPQRSRLTSEDGPPGDAWSREEPRDPDCQLTVMRHDVAVLIANGQAETLFGDNLLVAMELSYDNLPPGTRLRIGDAIIEVTAKPHRGCKKFRARFGLDALRFTAGAAGRRHNVRGMHWRVVESGDISVGANLEVLCRPP
jgi:MOSC domain